jgi:hypothetical protein
MTFLKWAVALSGLYSAAASIYLIFRARSFGQRPFLAARRGSPSLGMAYALGKGLMPWEKESTRLHIFTYTAGIIYHLGVFSAFFILFSEIVPVRISSVILGILRLSLALGLLAGLGLLFKRVLKSQARRLSCPDDFGANIFVNVFIAGALALSWTPSAAAFFLAYAVFLFIYIPAGKIRHCVFFFYSRILFGLFFGRRGVLPPGNARG